MDDNNVQRSALEGGMAGVFVKREASKGSILAKASEFSSSCMPTQAYKVKWTYSLRCMPSSSENTVLKISSFQRQLCGRPSSVIHPKYRTSSSLPSIKALNPPGCGVSIFV